MSRALLLHPDLRLEVADWVAPAPGDGEVSLRPEAAGVCGSDLHVLATGAWVTAWPAVLGHEVVGVVTHGPLAGQRVVVDSRLPCRACDDCARSPRLCANLTWLGESRPGGFASTLTAPQSSLVPVPHGLAPDVAVLAEPLAVALCALDAVPAPPARVLVLGYGPVGALVHAAVGQRWPEARVRVLETEPGRAALAERLGSLPDDDDAHDLVVDAAAFPGSVALAVARVRRGGTVVLVGLGSAPIDVSTQALVEKGVTLHGSIGFDDAHLPAALAMLAAAPARFAGLVSDRVPLSGLADFLARSGPRPVGKVVVDCAS